MLVLEFSGRVFSSNSSNICGRGYGLGRGHGLVVISPGENLGKGNLAPRTMAERKETPWKERIRKPPEE